MPLRLCNQDVFSTIFIFFKNVHKNIECFEWDSMIYLIKKTKFINFVAARFAIFLYPRR